MENLFYTFGSIAFGFYIFQHIYALYISYMIEHDMNCEQCADDRLAETFKKVRERDDDN